jgi:hypothetical protein
MNMNRSVHVKYNACGGAAACMKEFFMKTKFFVAGMLAMALAFGLLLIGCDTGTSSGSGAPAKVTTPTASPAAGVVLSGKAITLSTSTSGAMIYYTTNNSVPTSNSTAYSDSSKPTITGLTTIKAIAYKGGMTDSGVLTAAYTIADFANPPDIVADVATAKAYFELIWNDIPGDWQTFFATIWAEEGADGGGVVDTDLNNVDNEVWWEMIEGWPQYHMFWPTLVAKMEADEKPTAAPPVWPSDGTVIKSYLEGIWDDPLMTNDWKDYYLETIMYYYNYDYTDGNADDITLPNSLSAVDDKVWNYMKTAWNGSKWEPEDAQHIFEHLAVAINFGLSPGEEIDGFIGIVRK